MIESEVGTLAACTTGYPFKYGADLDELLHPALRVVHGGLLKTTTERRGFSKGFVCGYRRGKFKPQVRRRLLHFCPHPACEQPACPIAHLLNPITLSPQHSAATVLEECDMLYRQE